MARWDLCRPSDRQPPALSQASADNPALVSIELQAVRRTSLTGWLSPQPSVVVSTIGASGPFFFIDSIAFLADALLE